jgi:hypothetical protein
MLLAVTPLIAGFLNVPDSVSLFGVLLAVVTLAAALPTAMLLARGLIWPLAIGSIAEAVARIALYVVLGRLAPVELSILISIAVTVLGA